jgi:Major Facilitator Superfamily
MCGFATARTGQLCQSCACLGGASADVLSSTVPGGKTLMTTNAAAIPGAGGDSREARGGGRGGEARAISVVSAAHFVQHFQSLVLPPLFPFLKATLGIGFVELGFALTVASITAVAAQLPVGFLVDKVGSRLMLVLGLALSAAALQCLRVYRVVITNQLVQSQNIGSQTIHLVIGERHRLSYGIARRM